MRMIPKPRTVIGCVSTQERPLRKEGRGGGGGGALRGTPIEENVNPVLKKLRLQFLRALSEFTASIGQGIQSFSMLQPIHCRGRAVYATRTSSWQAKSTDKQRQW